MTAQRGLLALLAAIIGTTAMVFSFAFGIPAALDGGGSGSLVYQIVFLIGAALVVAALVISIVRLVRGPSRALPAVTMVVALIPIVTVVVIAVVARSV